MVSEYTYEKAKTVYVKEDFSNSTEAYYFTDGIDALSKNYSFKGMIAQCKFLISLGFKVESDVIDLSHYIPNWR